MGTIKGLVFVFTMAHGTGECGADCSSLSSSRALNLDLPDNSSSAGYINIEAVRGRARETKAEREQVRKR